jgi:anti-sigma28 factor (negative regulator of flagellin synthesis)
MIGLKEKKRNRASNAERIEELKQKINNEEYLYGAIFRIAQVLSNEIMGLPQSGVQDERQWRESRG